MSCEEHRFCEECRDWEGNIHAAAKDTRELAEAIEEIVWTAQEAAKVSTPNEWQRGRLLNAIEGLAYGIYRKVEVDIESETREPRKPERPTPQAVTSGDSAS